MVPDMTQWLTPGESEMTEGRRGDRPLRASMEMAAAPEGVWQVISDLRRTGEWSPECSRVVALGKVRQGAWLLGLNHRRKVRWATLSHVVSLVPEREISWKVVTNGSIWSYRLEPIDTGTRVIETRETPNGVGGAARAFTRTLLGGQRAHDDELEAGMYQGLGLIKAIVER
jgi:uncharacterized protein YndB with AHSA1/START domain